MGVKNLTDNKKYWKTVKPFFNSKNQNSNKIFLSENGSILDRPKVVATTFNNYFVNITKTLELGFSTDNLDNFQNTLRELVFAWINFRGFLGFSKNP